MRLVSTLLTAFCLAAAVPSVFAQSTDEEQIRAIITEFSGIWARADVDAFGALLTEDAQWVVRSGTYLNGRPEIVAHHAQLMNRNFAGSRVVWNLLDLRFPRPDVAIAHVAAQLTLRDGTDRTPGTVTIVFLRGADRWMITAVQNTDRLSQ